MVLRILIFCNLIISSSYIYSQDYAQIKKLKENDILFKELTSEILENNRRLVLAKEPLPLMFYRYQSQKDETLFTIAARLNLSYDTIASVNGFSSPLMFENESSLLLPNMNGLAIDDTTKDSFFKVLIERLKSEPSKIFYLINKEGQRLAMKFVPNQRFSNDERIEFLQGFFRSPLDGKPLLTSGFGQRSDPFGKGSGHHHNGYDYAAKVGTPVFASREGIVKSTAYNKLYGNHVIIKHSNGYETLYGHLSTFNVVKGNKVWRNSNIAMSGNTGASTGPHLHFEVRQFGQPINPAILLKKMQGQ